MYCDETEAVLQKLVDKRLLRIAAEMLPLLRLSVRLRVNVV